MTIKPLFMWAGGKNKLLKQYRPIIANSMMGKSVYVEPFFGGGAVFCHISNEYDNQINKYYINDVNKEIMGIYESIKSCPDVFIDKTSLLANNILAEDALGDRKKVYYDMRQKYWDSPSSELLYVLMKFSFNGVWQTSKNSKGLFATPAGLLNQKDITQIVDVDNIYGWHKVLQKTIISAFDYKNLQVWGKVDNGLFFVDPPYRNVFTTYSTFFDDGCQKSLVSLCEKTANSGGNSVLLSNKYVDDGFWESVLPKKCESYFFDVKHTVGRVNNNGDKVLAKEMLVDF